MARVELPRKTSSPPGAAGRAASGMPPVRVGPDRGAVLGHGEVEGSVRERHLLAERLQELKAKPEPFVAAAGGLELRRCRVDAHNCGRA